MKKKQIKTIGLTIIAYSDGRRIIGNPEEIVDKINEIIEVLNSIDK